MINYIEQNFEQHKKIGILFVNLSSAYDTVWLLGLAFKMTNILPDLKMFKAIRDMISNRSFIIQIDKNKSSLRILRNGLPQGSVMAPYPF